MNSGYSTPQWRGARIFWADGIREATITRVDYDVRERSEYIGSPVQEIHGGATEVRENLAPILRWAASMASMTSGGRRASQTTWRGPGTTPSRSGPPSPLRPPPPRLPPNP